MIYYKTQDEIELIRESALLVSKTLGLIAREIAPGVTTKYLDKLAEEFIRDNGGEPAFKGYHGFPASLCTSINEVVVHGIPSDQTLQNGDILSVDCGVYKNGFNGDHAYTFMVGEVNENVKKLLKTTRESLDLGIKKMTKGNRIGDISYAIQKHNEENGFGVVREMVGHGLGKNIHEDPQVPNYGKRGKGAKIQNGMVLAIEPMINMGSRHIKQLRDGWSIVTKDGKPSAHYEHNIAVVDGKPEVLSTFDYVEEELSETI